MNNWQSALIDWRCRLSAADRHRYGEDRPMRCASGQREDREKEAGLRLAVALREALGDATELGPS